MDPRDFAHFEDNGLSRFYHFFRSNQLLQFPDLPRHTPLNTFDHFRYIQIRSFLQNPQHTSTASANLAQFERDCVHNPIHKGQISFIYLQLNSSSSADALSYTKTWEKDIGPPNDPLD
ncbi:Hypothetical predicted protein [Pelobates cultripes]|uniref:Uncharacterized protein n=1 Tax=Pelobates cultripes TaxID=61616 RepID=A0AAD1WLJ1_PELCU|nr:Hypothetical predicted protein [Pelobates cultripes]